LRLLSRARWVIVSEPRSKAADEAQLGSAGIDVYPDEPTVNPKLVAMDNITLLPHMGTETRDTQKKASNPSSSLQN
jgi:lactate dehydrogenase-like 2-hydroxyacid dehydrogenase